MLSVVVQPIGEKLSERHFQKSEEQRAENCERHRTEQNDERIAEAVELRGENEKDQDDGKSEKPRRTCCLPCAAGAIRRCNRGRNLSAKFCAPRSRETSARVQRTRRHAADGDRVELLHAIERARDGFVFDRRHRAQRNQLIVRTGDVNVFQLLRIQTIDAFDLRNHLVAAAGDVEPVDEVAADAGGEVGADLLHVQTHRRDFVVIENDLRLRLIDLGVDVRESEHARLHRFRLNLLREFEDAFRIGG